MHSRVSWIDTAKGLSIVLVVYSHSITAVHDLAPPHQLIGAINYWLRDIRMPLFMLVSGILAANVLSGSWRGLWKRRLANLLWLYCIWSVIIAAAYSFTGEAHSFLRQIYAPDTQLWYLAALVFYIPAAKLLRSLGTPAALGISLLVHFLAALLPGDPFVYETSARLFIFFVFGATLAPEIMDCISKGRFSIGSVGLAGLALSLAMRQEMGVTIFGIAAVFAVAAIAATVLPRLSNLMGAVGRVTLPIFCLHGIILVFLSEIGTVTVPGLDVWGVFAFTALSIVGSLAIYRVLEPARYLWQAPELRAPIAPTGRPAV